MKHVWTGSWLPFSDSGVCPSRPRHAVGPAQGFFHFALLLKNPSICSTGNGGATRARAITLGSMNPGRRLHTATLLPTGLVLVAGGADASSPLASAELYYPASGTWTNTHSLNTAREYHTETLTPNGLVLVAAGYGASGALASAELYSPAAGTWTYTASLNTARYYHTATLLPSGFVLVAGGENANGENGSGELYCPY